MLPYIMYHKNEPFLVRRKIHERNFVFKNKLELKAVEMYMKGIGANRVLKMEGVFIFVNIIEEAEIIEEWAE